MVASVFRMLSKLLEIIGLHSQVLCGITCQLPLDLYISFCNEVSLVLWQACVLLLTHKVT